MVHKRLALGCVACALLLPAQAVAAKEAFGGSRVALLGGLDRTDSAPGTGARDAFYYAAQVGHDWSLARTIIGLEADVAGSTGSAPFGTGTARQGVFASAAVRLGYAVSNGLLVFARGGYAYHEIGFDGGGTFSGSGYTLGGGAEAPFVGRLFLRAEYRFSDYGETVRGQQVLGGIGLRF